MNRDQYLAKRMWLCGGVTEPVAPAKNLAALLGGSDSGRALQTDPGTALPVGSIGSVLGAASGQCQVIPEVATRVIGVTDT
jgi:hypothetical protein